MSVTQPVPDLAACANLLQHRGPDNTGVCEGSGYRFYHHRLAILDIGESSNQPLEDERYVLIYNGEIYNYRELYRDRLGGAPPASDTLALFEMLQAGGMDVVSELNGMFAFAFWDKLDKRLFLARDRVGIKPVYYTLHQERFCFASELKALLALVEELFGHTPRAILDRSSVDDIMALGHPEFSTLPYRDLVELAPGHVLEYRTATSELTTTAYFSLSDRPQASRMSARHDERELIDELDRMLQRSVAAHLLSDVKVGTLCSGGVDSSLVTAMAVRNRPDVAIYHAGVKGGGGEEDYARLVAKHLDISINFIEMDAETYVSLFPLATYYSDLPIYHPSDISLYAIAQLAKQQGVKVLLCGEGADELFGGYGWHEYIRKTRARYKVSRHLMNLVELVVRTAGVYKHARTFRGDRFMALTPTYLNYFSDALPVFAWRNSLIRNPKAWNFFTGLLDSYRDAGCDDPELAAVISNNLEGHLRSLLHRNDRMCMMASIEARVPFLENEVIDFGMNLSPEFKIRQKQGKYLLKKVAERYLPRKVVYRKKAGFPVPWRSYPSLIDKKIFSDGFLSWYLGLNKRSMELWMGEEMELLVHATCLEVWGRIHVLQQSPDDVRRVLLKQPVTADSIDEAYRAVRQ